MDTDIELDRLDFDITTDDIPGWLVASEGRMTVALDVTLSDELKSEGIARELVSRIQNYRKDSGLEVMDRINLTFDTNEIVKAAIDSNADYICAEVLADGIAFNTLDAKNHLLADLEECDTVIGLQKL